MTDPANDPRPLDPDAPRAAAIATTLTDLFVFRLCGRAYAMPATAIDLVAPAQAAVPVPTAPAHVAGVVHLRGRILAVVDLAALLGVERFTPGADDDRRLVVVGARPHPWAFAADATLGLHSVDADAIVGGDDDDAAAGRVEAPAGAITVLDPTALLARLVGREGST